MIEFENDNKIVINIPDKDEFHGEFSRTRDQNEIKASICVECDISRWFSDVGLL